MKNNANGVQAKAPIKKKSSTAIAKEKVAADVKKTLATLNHALFAAPKREIPAQDLSHVDDLQSINNREYKAPIKKKSSTAIAKVKVAAEVKKILATLNHSLFAAPKANPDRASIQSLSNDNELLTPLLSDDASLSPVKRTAG